VSILNGTPATALIEPAAPNIIVIEASPGPEFDAVLDIRRRVFGVEQGMIEQRASDQDDRRSLQALAYCDIDGEYRPAGTGRLTLNAGERGEALISWVATLPDLRHLGVGRAVMRYLIDYADAEGVQIIALAAQMHAEPFYLKLGFTGTGRTYFVQGVEHRWMVRRSPRRMFRFGL
jgi:predicted GNAT family N-acyltransferase